MTDTNQPGPDEQVYDDEQFGDRGIPSVASGGGNKLLIGGVFGILLLLAGGFVIMDASRQSEPDRRLTDPEDETFTYARSPSSTPQLVPAPSAPEEPPAQNNNRRDIEGERQRLAMLQAEAIKRQEAERKRQIERIQSPQLAYSGGNDVPAVSSSAGSLAAFATPTQQNTAGLLAEGQSGQPAVDPDEAFFDRVAGREYATATAEQLGNLDTLIPQGTLIPGILETAISTDVRGQIRAITTQNVWSMDQSQILIPRGSRLIGEYNADIRQGQGRLYVIWNRLIRSDGVSIQVSSGGTDDLGRAGLDGDLDTHFKERFGAAIILTIIDGAIEALAEAASDRTDNSIQLGDGGSGLDRAIEETVRQNVNIRPTIHVDQGERINVFLARDLDFSTVE